MVMTMRVKVVWLAIAVVLFSCKLTCGVLVVEQEIPQTPYPSPDSLISPFLFPLLFLSLSPFLFPSCLSLSLFSPFAMFRQQEILNASVRNVSWNSQNVTVNVTRLNWNVNAVEEMRNDVTYDVENESEICKQNILSVSVNSITYSPWFEDFHGY